MPFAGAFGDACEFRDEPARDLAAVKGCGDPGIRGHASLLDYGVRRLGLSEGSVALRVQAANVARRFRQMLDALAAERISLSVASTDVQPGGEAWSRAQRLRPCFLRRPRRRRFR